MERLVVNLSGSTRKETLHGRTYTVAPMVMLTEGVHPGSNGPLLYTANELRKTPAVWNHKPIVVYHPTANGQHVSACSPEILATRQVGLIMNTKYVKKVAANGTTPAQPGKLTAEAWIEDSLAANVDNRVVTALTNNTMMELSTGVFTDNDNTAGEFSGKKYVGSTTNYRPDHLALLPDKKGACSIADGAGFIRNDDNTYTPVDFREPVANGVMSAKSFDDIQSDLSALLQEEYPPVPPKTYCDCWVRDVYDKFFIYSMDGKLYRQSYNVDADGETSFVGDATEVVRVSQYRTLDGTVVNSSSIEEQNVDKKAKVDALIANKALGWTENDRAFLGATPEANLDKLLTANMAPAAQAAPVVNANPAPAAVATPAPTGIMTVNDYLASAPPEFRGMLVNGMNTYNQSCATTIQKIMACPTNTFTANALQGLPLDTLTAMAALIQPPQAQPQVQPVANWLGNMQYPVNPTPAQTAPVANTTPAQQAAAPALTANANILPIPKMFP